MKVFFLFWNFLIDEIAFLAAKSILLLKNLELEHPLIQSGLIF